MNAVRKEEARQKTIAIIQTTRIGDILQTTHAVKLLKVNHPEFRVILIARKKFSEPIKFLLETTFDKIVQIEHKSAFNSVETTRDVVANLNKQMKEINEEEIDVSINLAFSKSSTYLHSLIHSSNKVGPYFNDMHERVIGDKWSQYLYSTVMRGDLNPYNLVDLFSAIIGVKKKLTHLSNKEFSHDEKTKLLIHPFASKDNKMWKTNRWLEVIYQTLKKSPDLKLYICGTNTEKDKIDELLSSSLLAPYQSRIEAWINLDLKELYNRVDENFLFVGHDSMVGNLLSFKNIKSLTISLGPVRPHETTPYGLDKFNLAPRNANDHNDVPYNVAHQCIIQLLKKNQIKTEELHNACSSLSINQVKLYRSDMLDNGDVTIKEILHKEQDAKEIMRNFYHIAWSSIFNEVNLSMDIPHLSSEAKTQLKSQAKGIETLYELSEFGKKYSRYIIEEVSKNTPSLEEIKKYSAKLNEIDNLSDFIVTTSPLLAPVVDYGKVAKNNLSGKNIVKLSESAFYTYNEVSLMCSVLYEFFDKCSLITKTETAAVRENV